MCGSANGITITLNKHQGIRAAICWEPEIASLARKHNDANVCSMPARFIDRDTAIRIVDTFLSTEFEGGRHQRRIDKIRFRDAAAGSSRSDPKRMIPSARSGGCFFRRAPLLKLSLHLSQNSVRL